MFILDMNLILSSVVPSRWTMPPRYSPPWLGRRGWQGQRQRYETKEDCSSLFFGCYCLVSIVKSGELLTSHPSFHIKSYMCIDVKHIVKPFTVLALVLNTIQFSSEFINSLSK